MVAVMVHGLVSSQDHLKPVGCASKPQFSAQSSLIKESVTGEERDYPSLLERKESFYWLLRRNEEQDEEIKIKVFDTVS